MVFHKEKKENYSTTTESPDQQSLTFANFHSGGEDIGGCVKVTRWLESLTQQLLIDWLEISLKINSVWPNTKLANYWIKRAEFEKTNETFEDVIARVMKIRDFTTIYVEPFKRYQEEKLDTRMIEFDKLMNRRLFLANALLLRQNPSDIQKREKWEILHGN
ncbi:hypothetical protein BY996DRAFT_8392219 [Phakopsora pachyrhizi]|nr:hypothetical protein BY996DRAFT_8392219 [Phakopsora pachyrhizi]